MNKVCITERLCVCVLNVYIVYLCTNRDTNTHMNSILICMDALVFMVKKIICSQAAPKEREKDKSLHKERELYKTYHINNTCIAT